LAYLRQRDYRRAAADFDQGVALQPDLTEAYLNRALAWQGLGRDADAGQDLTRAIDLGTAHARVYFLRARAREKVGDREGAGQDRQAGLRREPNDEKSFIARGLARLPGDANGALADFDQALALNPRSLAALQNKAHVLAKLGRNEAALGTLDGLVALYP